MLFMDQVKMVEQEVKQWIWQRNGDSDSEYVLRSSGVESLMERTCVDNSSDVLYNQWGAEKLW